ncbi:MAG TPA: NADH-quinone oxidoreductase subunit N [Planctomycetota bacterium]|nr:NADH-quinone oxidoreductase subunit N [Planctomycetota bacterium]
MNELIHLAPIGVVLAAALVVIFVDLVLAHKDRYILPWLALTGCILGMISIFQTQSTLMDQVLWFFSYKPQAVVENPLIPGYPLILNGAFCIDGFGMFIWIIACFSGALAILASPPHSDESALSTGEYYGLILLAVAGMMLLAVSHDWLTLLLSLEIMSIATYILTGSAREEVRSNEAAMKYLVLGAFSTAFLLMGIAFFYGAFGTLTLKPSQAFASLPAAVREPREFLAYISMGFLLVGALFKIGASPFHFWIPDVYQGAPTAVTGFMASGVKAAAFAVLARILFETFGAQTERVMWIPIVLAAAVLTMVIGNILAMSQSNVKRMLAYSGIAHTGYLLLAFLIMPGHNDSATMDEHLKAVVFYLFVYGVMTLGAFGVIALVRENGKPLETIEDYAGLARQHPAIALCMSIFMLSLAGMPPLGGFFAKFMIFRAAIEQGSQHNQAGFIAAAVIGILTSVASLYYYLRVIVAMYFSPAGEHGAEEAASAPACRYAWGTTMLIYAAGVVTLILGILPGGLLDWLK